MTVLNGPAPLASSNTVAPGSEMPLVSAIIIFLNPGRFLVEALESVVEQTYPRWELVLVDDGSTDGTSGTAREFAARHAGRARYLEHRGHRNRGMSASRNAGVRASKGALIAFLDADDVWLPEKLSVQVHLLQMHPEAAMIAGPTRLWYGWNGRPEDMGRDSPRLVTAEMDTLFRPRELLRLYLADRALTPATCSVLVRREAIERIGGSHEGFRGLYEDQVLFLKAYMSLPIYLTSTCTDWYRQHPDSHSAEATRAGLYFDDRPGPALAALFLWLTWHVASRGVVDGRVWMPLLAKLWRLGMYAAITAVNPWIKRLLALWHWIQTPRPLPSPPNPDQGSDNDDVP